MKLRQVKKKREYQDQEQLYKQQKLKKDGLLQEKTDQLMTIIKQHNE